MNIRGVSFRVPQGRNDILQEILDGINVQTLFWYNVESQNEVWSVPHYKDFFREEYYSGQDFYEQIKLPHQPLWLQRIYRKGSSADEPPEQCQRRNSQRLQIEVGAAGESTHNNQQHTGCLVKAGQSFFF